MNKDNRAQFKLRLKAPLHKRIIRSARKSKQPINAEIIERLEASYTVQRNDYLLDAAASYIKYLLNEVRKLTDGEER